jgi:hypothetical protein
VSRSCENGLVYVGEKARSCSLRRKRVLSSETGTNRIAGEGVKKGVVLQTGVAVAKDKDHACLELYCSFRTVELLVKHAFEETARDSGVQVACQRQMNVISINLTAARETTNCLSWRSVSTMIRLHPC